MKGQLKSMPAYGVLAVLGGFSSVPGNMVTSRESPISPKFIVSPGFQNPPAAIPVRPTEGATKGICIWNRSGGTFPSY